VHLHDAIEAVLVDVEQAEVADGQRVTAGQEAGVHHRGAEAAPTDQRHLQC
jgi:hypothetical protein